MSDQLLPFLMFEGRAEEAMRFYVSVFPKRAVIEIARYGKGAAGAEGTVSRAKFTIAGQTLMCSDSTVKNAFAFTSRDLAVRPVHFEGTHDGAGAETVRGRTGGHAAG